MGGGVGREERSFIEIFKVLGGDVRVRVMPR